MVAAFWIFYIDFIVILKNELNREVLQPRESFWSSQKLLGVYCLERVTPWRSEIHAQSRSSSSHASRCPHHQSGTTLLSSSPRQIYLRILLSGETWQKVHDLYRWSRPGEDQPENTRHQTISHQMPPDHAGNHPADWRFARGWDKSQGTLEALSPSIDIQRSEWAVLVYAEMYEQNSGTRFWTAFPQKIR